MKTRVTEAREPRASVLDCALSDRQAGGRAQRLQVRNAQFSTFQLSIPKGLWRPAQGCEARATLGIRDENEINPNGVASHVEREMPQPRWGWNLPDQRSQGSACRATLGFGSESRWDSIRVGDFYGNRKPRLSALEDEKRVSPLPFQRLNAVTSQAFTLIELLVVIAIIAILGECFCLRSPRPKQKHRPSRA